MSIVYQKDIKYQLYEDSQWQLLTPMQINYSLDCGWYGVDKEAATIYAREGFAWDGATMFPDFKWILEGSLWHDVLHLLIAQGAIPVSENNAIDKELTQIIRTCGGVGQSHWLARLRAHYVKKATGLVHQQVTQARPVYQLHKGKVQRIK